MTEKKALAIAVAIIINSFIIAVTLALTLNADGLLVILGFTVFTLQLILSGVKVYAFLLNQ